MARTAIGSNDFRAPAIGQPTFVSAVTYSGSLKCDIWKPGVANRPCIIIFHGGAWGATPQTRNTFPVYASLAAKFAAYGFAVINADYTPANGTPQDAIDDGLALVQWARDNAGTYNIDSTRIVVLGVSSGGHLMLMIGIQGTPGASRPDAGVVWSAVADMEDSYTYVPAEMERVFGVALLGNEALYRSLSPVDVMDASCCPLRIVGSDAEETDVGSEGPPVTQYTDLATAAAAVGVSVTSRIFEGLVHGFFDATTPDNGRLGTNDIPGTCRWIIDTLGETPAASSRTAASNRTAAVGRVAA